MPAPPIWPGPRALPLGPIPETRDACDVLLPTLLSVQEIKNSGYPCGYPPAETLMKTSYGGIIHIR